MKFAAKLKAKGYGNDIFVLKVCMLCLNIGAGLKVLHAKGKYCAANTLILFPLKLNNRTLIYYQFKLIYRIYVCEVHFV